MARFAFVVFLALLSLAPTRAEAEELGYETRLVGGAGEGDAAPLVIAIHGLGDRPESFVSLLRRLPVPARVVAPRAPVPWKRGFSWYDVRAAQAGREADIARSTEALAACFPELVGEAFPIAGRLPESLRGLPRGMPPDGLRVLAHHGTADARLPIDGARASIAFLVAAGYDARLQEHPGGKHRVPRAVLDDVAEAVRRAGGTETR